MWCRKYWRKAGPFRKPAFVVHFACEFGQRHSNPQHVIANNTGLLGVPVSDVTCARMTTWSGLSALKICFPRLSRFLGRCPRLVLNRALGASNRALALALNSWFSLFNGFTPCCAFMNSTRAPKAQAISAWGNAPGTHPARLPFSGPKARANWPSSTLDIQVHPAVSNSV